MTAESPGPAEGRTPRERPTIDLEDPWLEELPAREVDIIRLTALEAEDDRRDEDE